MSDQYGNRTAENEIYLSQDPVMKQVDPRLGNEFQVGVPTTDKKRARKTIG